MNDIIFREGHHASYYGLLPFFQVILSWRVWGVNFSCSVSFASCRESYRYDINGRKSVIPYMFVECLVVGLVSGCILFQQPHSLGDPFVSCLSQDFAVIGVVAFRPVESVKIVQVATQWCVVVSWNYQDLILLASSSWLKLSRLLCLWECSGLWLFFFFLPALALALVWEGLLPCMPYLCLYVPWFDSDLF